MMRKKGPESLKTIKTVFFCIDEGAPLGPPSSRF